MHFLDFHVHAHFRTHGSTDTADPSGILLLVERLPLLAFGGHCHSMCVSLWKKSSAAGVVNGEMEGFPPNIALDILEET